MAAPVVAITESGPQPGRHRHNRIAEMTRARSVEIYLKPGFQDDDLIFQTWLAVRGLANPQSVFRRALLTGLTVMARSGELPGTIGEAVLVGDDPANHIGDITPPRWRRPGTETRQDRHPRNIGAVQENRPTPGADIATSPIPADENPAPGYQSDFKSSPSSDIIPKEQKKTSKLGRLM